MQKIKDIEFLRFPLAVFVVMEHTLPHYDIADNIKPILYLIFDTFLRDNSVPVFFFISGFLFFNNTATWNLGVWRDKMRRRVHTLFIPYIIWNVYAIFFLWVAMKCGMNTYMAAGAEFTPSLRNIAISFWTYDSALVGTYIPTIFPINVATWYIRDLIFMCLISPAIYSLLNKFPLPTLAVVLIAWIFAGTYATALLFFTTGAYYAINRKALPRLSRNSTTMAFILYLLSALIVCVHPELLGQYELPLKKINIISFLFLTFRVSANIKTARHTDFVSNASVFLFLSHQPLCGKINKIIIMILKPQNVEYLTIINIFAITLTVTGTFIVYHLLSTYTPRILYVLTGRRQSR